VDTLCDRLAILVGGRVRATGSLEQLKQELGGGYKVSRSCSLSLLLQVNLKLVPGTAPEAVSSLLGAVPGLQFLGQQQHWLTYRVPGQLSAVLGLLASSRQQGSLQGFTINMTSLDDIFLEVTSGGKGQQGTLELKEQAGATTVEQPYNPLGAEEVESRSPREEAVYRRPGSMEEGGGEEPVV